MNDKKCCKICRQLHAEIERLRDLVGEKDVEIIDKILKETKCSIAPEGEQ